MEVVFWYLNIVFFLTLASLGLGLFLGWWLGKQQFQCYLDQKEWELAQRTREYWILKQQRMIPQKSAIVESEDVDVSLERAKLTGSSKQAIPSELA